MFAPLLLVFVAWLLVKLAKLRWRIALAIVCGLTLIIWLPQRIAFQNRCNEFGEPLILKTVTVDGFFLEDPTANSFGMRYLHEAGFSWLETNSIYNRAAFTRYEKVGDKIESHEIDKLSAEYVLRSVHTDEGMWRVQEVEIANIKTGEKLASAKSAHFEGGTAKWVLGAYGSATCPNPRTAEGSRLFRKTYNLAWETLRGETKQ